jgi:hypothetical protein
LALSGSLLQASSNPPKDQQQQQQQQGLTLTMYMLSSPCSRLEMSTFAGTGTRCWLMSTTGAPARQLPAGTLPGMSYNISNNISANSTQHMVKSR